MVDKVNEIKTSKKNKSLAYISSLVHQADRARASYDYQLALELYQKALIALEQELAKNGGDDSNQRELRFTIHDGCAKCYNLLAEADHEIGELTKMERLATELDDQSRGVNAINRQVETKFTSGDIDQALSLSRKALKLSRKIGDRDEEAQSLMLLSQIQVQLGKAEESIRNNREALTIFRETGNL